MKLASYEEEVIVLKGYLSLLKAIFLPRYEGYRLSFSTIEPESYLENSILRIR